MVGESTFCFENAVFSEKCVNTGYHFSMQSRVLGQYINLTDEIGCPALLYLIITNVVVW